MKDLMSCDYFYTVQNRLKSLKVTKKLGCKLKKVPSIEFTLDRGFLVWELDPRNPSHFRSEKEAVDFLRKLKLKVKYEEE